MAAGDISDALVADLELRLEDAASSTFTDAIKFKALEVAQIQLAHMLDNSYLTELETLEQTLTVSSSYVAFSGLANTVFRGHEGIIRAALQFGGAGSYYWCTRLDIDRLKRLENTYMDGSDTNPLFWTFQQRVYFDATTPNNDKAKILYLKYPTAITTSVDPTLNSSLHPLMVIMAEAYCWALDGKLDRRKAALDIAFTEIKNLNERVTPAEGIGTRGRLN